MLRYGDPQIAIGIVFAVLALLIAAAFIVIGVQAGSDVSFERVHRVGYWLRKRWLALLLVLGVLVFGISLFDLPYASGSGNGRTVVNHGFGLYDPHGHLIGSVQAMPGYHNKLDLTLAQAGVYRIRCLELCGLNHSTMESTFTVTQR